MVEIQFGDGIILLDHMRLKSISIQDNSIFIRCSLKHTNEISLIGCTGSIPEEVLISDGDGIKDEGYIKKVIGMFERNKIKIKRV
jgi:hypothetical protein